VTAARTHTRAPSAPLAPVKRGRGAGGEGAVASLPQRVDSRKEKGEQDRTSHQSPQLCFAASRLRVSPTATQRHSPTAAISRQPGAEDRSRAGKPELPAFAIHSCPFVSIRGSKHPQHSCPFVVQNTPQHSWFIALSATPAAAFRSAVTNQRTRRLPQD